MNDNILLNGISRIIEFYNTGMDAIECMRVIGIFVETVKTGIDINIQKQYDVIMNMPMIWSDEK